MKNEKYLSFIRTKPCLFCGDPETEPHHVRISLFTPPSWRGGMGRKPSDYMCLPLCRVCHTKVHNGDLLIDQPDYKVMEMLGEYIEYVASLSQGVPYADTRNNK